MRAKIAVRKIYATDVLFNEISVAITRNSLKFMKEQIKTGILLESESIPVDFDTYIEAKCSPSEKIWPVYGGNIRHTGQSIFDTSDIMGKIVWAMSGDFYIYSSAAIGADGSAYFGLSAWPRAYLMAVKPDGATMFSFLANGIIGSQPAIGPDGSVYFGCDDKNLYALNPDGTLKWKYLTNDCVRSSPVIGEDGTIYFTSWDDNLYALNPDGTLKWKYQLGFLFSETTPAVAPDGTIYVSSYDFYLYAINPDGTLKWKLSLDGVGEYISIGTDGTIYVANSVIKSYSPYIEIDYMNAINPDGTLKWKYTALDMIVSGISIGKDNTIYFGDYQGNLYALNPDGTLKWRYKVGDSITDYPVIGADGTIYFSSYDGYLYALNPDGTLRWKTYLGSELTTGPTINANEMLYVGAGYALYAVR